MGVIFFEIKFMGMLLVHKTTEASSIDFRDP